MFTFFQDELPDAQLDAIEESTEILYNLIHARFILTPRGMKLMVYYFVFLCRLL